MYCVIPLAHPNRAVIDLDEAVMLDGRENEI